jgi:hypothetical protein
MMMRAKKKKVMKKLPDLLLRKSLSQNKIVQMKRMKKMRTAIKNQRRKSRQQVRLRNRKKAKKRRAQKKKSPHRRVQRKIMKLKTIIKMN